MDLIVSPEKKFTSISRFISSGKSIAPNFQINTTNGERDRQTWITGEKLELPIYVLELLTLLFLKTYTSRKQEKKTQKNSFLRF